MLNLLTKTKPWMVASLIVATSVFGQDSGNSGSKNSGAKSEKACVKPDCKPKACPQPCPQPCPPTQMCPPGPATCCPPWPVPVLNAAYSYPARLTTRCPWDIYFDVSFIYWEPIQENMELGFVNSTAPTAGSFATTTGINGTVSNMDFKYKPGFKIGFGWNMDYDNWDVHGEYTWFHNTQTKSIVAATGTQIFPFAQAPTFLGGNVSTSSSETWHLQMDLLDLDLGRWYYVGTKLTFRPSFGGRAAWIRQHLTNVYTNNGTIAGFTTDTATTKGRSTSWALGPKAGLDTNWMIGSGFRIFGNGSADLLYTRYNRLSFNETHTAAATSGGSPFKVSQRSVGTLRTHLDMELGIGWGTYWDCNNWHTDVALGYEFQAFFDQNMFRHFNDNTMSGLSTTPNGNLYVQGLTATFRLDF